MNDESVDRRMEEDGKMVTPHLTAVDAALATGDVSAALRAWHEAYGAAMGSRRWEGFADAGDAYLRIARASSASPRPSWSSVTTR